ncbi:hypothetical protein [Lysinibacillus sp. G4S2]|uniref:hypothetical protein n=1 Tax=Lysinibacillus sp. G4S2 TaxID=3055859 RepID=UPI0025A073E5|nr:hypothetical protein [Lysinibacillus sp. G4S2]MDM5247410.1 hypothetical protein [Lysinibacillus sp. G4S2]
MATKRRKRLDARPQEALLCATATNVLSVRKRSVSNKCFICAKAKRQQQMFYLCEIEATATKRVARSGNQPLRMYKNG